MTMKCGFSENTSKTLLRYKWLENCPTITKTNKPVFLEALDHHFVPDYLGHPCVRRYLLHLVNQADH